MAAKPKSRNKKRAASIAKRSTARTRRSTARARRPIARAKRLGDPRLADLAAQIVKKLGVARGCYKSADALLDELLAAGAKHGDVFVVNGKLRRLVDNFRGVNKVFRTTAVLRWSLDDDGEANE